MGDVAGTIGTVLDVAADAHMPEIICRVQQLMQIDRRQPVQACVDTPDEIAGSTSIGRITTALRAYSYAEQNPWIYPVAIAAIIGLPMLIGYELGKGKHS